MRYTAFKTELLCLKRKRESRAVNECTHTFRYTYIACLCSHARLLTVTERLFGSVFGGSAFDVENTPPAHTQSNGTFLWRYRSDSLTRGSTGGSGGYGREKDKQIDKQENRETAGEKDTEQIGND